MEVLVKAKYPYDYTNGHGAPAHMEPGDVFTLIKKSNDDWWYVRKVGDKPVYLPATYLQEQTMAASVPKLEQQEYDAPSRHGNHRNIMDEMNNRFKRNVIGSSEGNDRSQNRPNHLDVIVPAPSDNRDQLPSPYSDGSSPLYTPSRENSWNSVEQQSVAKNPNSSVTRNQWATRINNPPDSQEPILRGRQTTHQQRTNQNAGGGGTPHSPTISRHIQNDTPSGWRVEKTITGDPVFINEVTSEKWYKATNENGEVYYYSEDRAKTGWELPKVVTPSIRRRFDSEGGGGTGGGDDSRTHSRPTRHELARPRSFHPQLLPTGSNTSESRLVDDLYSYSKRASFFDTMDNEIVAQEKEGTITWYLMKDRGKRNKPRQGHVVLHGSQLKFYKDHKHYERDGSNPEVGINLWRGHVAWPKAEKGKAPKQTAFELQVDQGTYVLQGEDDGSTISWFEAISGAVMSEGRPRGGGRFLSPADSDESPLLSPDVSPPEQHARQKNNIKEKLKSFMIKRPDKSVLTSKGILKEENVFGRHIGKLCERERTFVPNFVMQCIQTIDRRGLKIDGIYRVNGNLSLMQKLRFQVDQEKPVDLDASPWKEDIHVIAGALKLYFRELPEPLFTFATFDRFLAAMSNLPERMQKISAFQELLKSMPKVNRETIKMLFAHLKRVMDNVQYNRMPAKNLATVFGPTLMWSDRDNINMTVAMVYQNQVIEFVLLEYDFLFR